MAGELVTLGPNHQRCPKNGTKSDITIKYMAGRKGLYEPGQHFYYSTGDPMLLSPVIQKAAGMTAFDFGEKIFLSP